MSRTSWASRRRITEQHVLELCPPVGAFCGEDGASFDQCLVMRWEYTQLRFVPRGKSWTGEIEELWLDDRQLISRSHPQRDVSLVGLMNELGEQGWELVTYAQPFTGYHGGCYTFKRQK